MGAIEHLHRLPRAARDDALEDRGDLIGGHRIDDLLALVDELRLGGVGRPALVAALADALVVPVDRVAPAILDTVD